MKPNSTQMVHHVEQGVGESMRMGMDSDSIVHLMQLLTDLYSNPILAFIREYSTNALDSHIDANRNEPILVTLPSDLEPHFIVQDFGLGLDVDDLRNVYSMYGKSTKRESDAVTGTLGLGCKSGLTYALSFTVTAIKRGLRTIAAVTKDIDGVGTIKILDTSMTDERNGVTVSIPVKANDIYRTRTEAESFFRYWRNGTVLVDGEEPTFYEKAIFLDPDVAVIPGSVGHRIVMGDVSYPFTHSRSDYTIVAWVPMGTVNFTPSREALHFTDRTNDTIKTIQQFVTDNLPIKILEVVAGAETPYEQLQLAKRWGAVGQGVLRGTIARSGLLELPDDVDAWSISRGQYDDKIRGSRWETVPLSNVVGVFPIVTGFPNKTVSNGHRQRLKAYGFLKDQNNVLVLPDGANLHYLEGRENVHAWSKIVEKTPEPEKGSSGGGYRTKTVYSVMHSGKSYATEEIDTKDPIVYATPQGYSYLLRKFPEAHCVVLKSRQVDRFVRLHPAAISAEVYQQSVIKECRKNLTQADKLLVGMDSGRMAALRGAAPHIKDPDLRKVVEAAQQPRSQWWTRLSDLNALGGTTENPIHQVLAERYPLLHSVSSYQIGNLRDDLVAYVNAKFQSTKETS